MSIAINESISAADINQLKAEVKAEMKRRSSDRGSVAAYGDTAYDYTITPEEGGQC